MYSLETMGKKYVITLLRNEGGCAAVKKVVSPNELFYRDTKDEIVECTEKFLDEYVMNPNARETIRYRVTGNGDDKDNNADSFARVRIVGFQHDEESENGAENQENETLGRGKRLMRKKIDMNTPDILVVKRNWESKKALLVCSQENNVKEIRKQHLRKKRELDKAKGIAVENALEKLEMNSTEILPVYIDNDKEEAPQLPMIDLRCGTGSEEITEARNGESRPGNSDDENVKEVEQIEHAEYDDSTVAGSEGIDTGNKVLPPTELKTDGMEDGQSEDRNKIATDLQEERDIAVSLSHGSHTDDNNSLGYIEDPSDKKRVVTLQMESELSEKIFISTDVLAPNDEENGEKGDSDDAPSNTYSDIGKVIANNADHPNRDTPSVTTYELTGNEASPRKGHDLDEERRTEKLRNPTTIETRSDKTVSVRTSTDIGKSKTGVSTPVHDIRDSGRTSKNIPKANKRIVVKKVESYPGTSAKSTSMRIANIAQQGNNGKITKLQETPMRQVTSLAARHLGMILSESQSIEGAGKVKTLGKEGNRSYDKCVGNESIGTVLDKDTEKEKVFEQWKKKKNAATGKNNVKKPKRACDVAPRDASQSKLPVISKGMEKATKKIMPPFSEPGTSSVQQEMGKGTATRRRNKTKREDLFEFEDSEEDVPKPAKKLKKKLLPVPAKLKERRLSHQNKTKSVRGKEQARGEKTHSQHGRTVVDSSSDRETFEDEQVITANSLASSERRMETIREMASEFNILIKQMNIFAKRLKNLCKEGSSDESHFEITGLEDENVDEIEVAPNWQLPRETVARAIVANSMSNRLGILMRSLWNEKTRNQLTTKKDGKGDAGRKRVSKDSAILLRNACYNLQSYKKLPLDQVKTVEDTMKSISQKLSYNRYNLIRQQKRTMPKQTVQEAALKKTENTSDDSDASINDDNDHDEGESEVDMDDDSGSN
ncbi:uncharacterized protein [Venturia canescens]|uniref:uncharacterized protein n=1 Tax=Venturia canescens TaxID=32260 RepID=UPI001C9D3A47|nr:uncharacterized protein LOC122407815 [Venturia canescens]